MCATGDFCNTGGGNLCADRVTGTGTCNTSGTLRCEALNFCHNGLLECRSSAANLSHECDQDGNCANTQYCNSDKSCQDRLVDNTTGCTADNQCLAASYCSTGNPRTCTAKSATTCASSNDAQCTTGNYCNVSTCTALIADTTTPCTKGTQCSTGFCSNSNQRCAAKPTTGDCGIDQDMTVGVCADTAYCSGTGPGTCMPRASSGGLCSANKCPFGEYCVKSVNTCSAVSASAGHSCESDISCVASQYCTQSRCKDRIASGSACTIAGSCVSTDYCPTGGGNCTPKAVTFRNACTTDNQCNGGYCANSLCTTPLDNGATCTKDSMCLTGLCSGTPLTCTALPTSGACASGKPTTSTTSSGICDPAAFCNPDNSQCTTRITVGTACTINNAQCASAHYCHAFSNVCTAATTSGSHTCFSDNHCAATQYCNSANNCVNKVASGGVCTADNMCPSTEYCPPGGGTRNCATKVNTLTANSCSGSNDAQCNNGFCDTTVCTPPKIDGEVCSRNAQCSSGYCHTSNNRCTAVPASGATCGTGKASAEICPSGEFCLTAGATKTCTARAGNTAACNVVSMKCAALHYCDRGDNTCKPVNANQGHTCDSDLNCADT